MNNKNDKVVAIIAIVIIVVVLSVVGYLVVKKMTKDINVSIDNKKGERKVSIYPDASYLIPSIPLQTCIIKNKTTNCNINHAYNNKKMTVDDINDADKIYTVIIFKELCKTKNDISLNDVSEGLIDLYGKDYVVKDTFERGRTSFSFKNDKYIIEGMSPKTKEEEYGDKDHIGSMNFVTKVTEDIDSGDLYVYNQNIAYKDTKPSTIDGTIIIYKDFGMKEEVARVKYKNLSDRLLSEYELKEILIKKYKKYVINFKHTFVKKDHHTIYYSTEPIKK